MVRRRAPSLDLAIQAAARRIMSDEPVMSAACSRVFRLAASLSYI
jgi:hypothetical protein